MSPTGRTLQHLRKLGYRADRVEQVVPKCFIRRDLFGIGDVLAMKENEPLLLVQVTTTAKLNNRMAKDPETCCTWLSTGNRLEFWGWAKQGPRGKRKVWTLTTRALQPSQAACGFTTAKEGAHVLP